MERTNRNRALVVVSLATGLSLLGDSSLYTVLATHTEDAGVALASVGILLSANRFIRLVLNTPIGWLVDRWPRRRIFVPAVFLGAASTAIYAFTSGFAPLLVGRLLWGIAWASLWVSGNAIVFDVAAARARGRGVGLYHLAFFLGAASGSLLGGVLTDWIGFHQTMLVNAALTGLGALAALFLLPETAGISRTSSDSDTLLPAPRSVVKPGKQLASAVALFGVNRVVVPGVFVPTFGLFLAGVVGDRAESSELTLGLATLTGLALSVATLISMVAAPLMGALSDRLGNRWTAASAGLGAGTAGFLAVALATPVAVVLGTPLISASSGSNQGLSTALVGDLSMRRSQGRQLGVLFTVGDLGSAVGPPLAFALLPVVGLPWIYAGCAALLAAMFVVALNWHRLTRRTPPSEH